MTVVVAAVVIAAWFLFGRGPGSFPGRAASFRLVSSRTIDAGIAAYAAGRTFEVRVVEDDLASSYPDETLLRAAGIGIVGEGDMGKITGRSIEGVRYTCVHTAVGAGCIWTEAVRTAWALGDGQRDVARLRQLARAVHDAMT